MKHSEYVKIVQSLAQDSLKKALMKAVLKKLPFLATGPMGIFLEKIVTKLAELAVEEAEMRIFFKYIDFRTDIQAKDFEQAMIHNYNMQMVGSDEDKKLATKRLEDALHKLVNLRL